jgi:hypothetical protein
MNIERQSIILVLILKKKIKQKWYVRCWYDEDESSMTN